jgi:hypothetical protein
VARTFNTLVVMRIFRIFLFRFGLSYTADRSCALGLFRGKAYLGTV